jgi:hypothetical protein
VQKQHQKGGRADSRPVIDLIIKQSDPRLYTELYMQVGREFGKGERKGGKGDGFR